ncbi:MAG: metallophosphoesterase family protein [Thermomicrobiales bacterium]
MRVLCTGDIHIGRRASRIPPALDGRHFSCASAWEAVVNAAIEHDVDLVAVSGDVVDRENRFFEAYGPLENGLRRLAAAGIAVFAVTGNHDFDVLPRLAESTAGNGLRLLGRGGRWETETVRRNGRPALHILGWSFPQEHVGSHPLADLPTLPTDGVPILAMLHADLDQPDSRYCPVPLAELRRHDAGLWLLGHIHVPRLFEGDGPPVLYPGSPLAMDPGETGVHGVWIVELTTGGVVAPRLVPVSPVRYVEVSLDLTGVADKQAFDLKLAECLRTTLHDELARPDCGPLECLSCRITLTGHTPVHRLLPGWVRTAPDDLMPAAGRATACIDTIEIATRPAIDLQRIATVTDPPGEIARLLLALDQDEPPAPYDVLVTRTTQRLRDLYHSATYGELASDAVPDATAAIHHLRQQGWLLLSTLVAQKQDAP